jgi:hypothetical protein
MLPDPQIGAYRGARFDWSGIISSLQYQGHEYFGQWYKHHDPKIHDAVTEPLEKFRTNDSGLGYEEAKPGDAFVRIGIGTVRKPEEKRIARMIVATLSTRENGAYAGIKIESSSAINCALTTDTHISTAKPCDS